MPRVRTTTVVRPVAAPVALMVRIAEIVTNRSNETVEKYLFELSDYPKIQDHQGSIGELAGL